MSRGHHQQWLWRQFSPLFLQFGPDGYLRAVDGEVAHYGFVIADMLGSRLESILPELAGIDVRTEQSLPLITLVNGTCVDIHIEPDRDGFMIVLLDSAKEKSRLSLTQQMANESSLRAREFQLEQQHLEQDNETLKQERMAQTTFISGMSHEFRTPILGMLGNIAWIGKELSLNDESQKKIQAIESNATYLLGLVDNLLEQGKISNDQLLIDKASVNPRHMFHSLIATLAPLAEKRRIVLAHEIKLPRDLRLFIDEYHLRRVLYNLLGNAIKFTDFGSVLLEVEYDDAMLVMRITDTGIGIPADDLDLIRQPFRRGSNVTNRRGVGLGLAHAHEICKAMEGQLDIESRVDEGTTVTIRLPAARSDAFGGKPTGDEQSSPRRVLLVEDSPEIASLYSFSFAEHHLPLIAVTNGADMQRVLSRIDPDILLIDRLLGDENGLELAKKVRENGYDGHIILLTATPDIDRSLERAAIDAGCNELIQKPMDVSRLVHLVQSRIESVAETRGQNQLNQLLNEYIASFPDKRRALSNELSRFMAMPESGADVQALKLLTHNISGSAGAYGFPRLSETAIRLERIIDRYDRQRQPEIRRQLNVACRNLIVELDKHSARP